MVGVLHRTGWSRHGVAISLDRFIASLQVLNQRELKNLSQIAEKPCSPLTIGLAISGGVDSMALASLCSGIQNKSQFGAQFKFRAFVVDHQVREGSADEARAVAKVLEEKDIPTDVLKIEWPNGINPKTASNFESLARTYRFQALGRACRSHQIQSLFLAHHRDDQAETILMRMINGHRKDGLCGMRLSGDIPECRGIYGVHQSGGADYRMAPTSKFEIDRVNGSGRTNYLDSPEHEIPPPFFSPSMKLESGGVKVYRPLLGFSKQELKSTCEANEISWFEDRTNADPTLTTRNAIRYIYANNKLPVALQKPSILSLARRLQNSRDEDAERRRKAFDQKVRVLTFEPSVPYCSVVFGPLDIGFNVGNRTHFVRADFEDASWWLRAVIQLISPVENVPLRTLNTAVKRVFTELDSQPVDRLVARKPFTVAGVMFEPVPSDVHESSSISNHPDLKSTAAWENLSPVTSKVADRHWIVRPQPSPRGKEPHLDFIPFQGKDEKTHWKDPDSWKLFDGRFWIRIVNLTSSNISVRPFRAEDVNKLKGTRLMAQLEEREESLLPIKASKFRYVLPVIVVEQDGTGQVVGLPSLGVIAEGFETLVKYQIRYRSLDSWPN